MQSDKHKRLSEHTTENKRIPKTFKPQFKILEWTLFEMSHTNISLTSIKPLSKWKECDYFGQWTKLHYTNMLHMVNWTNSPKLCCGKPDSHVLLKKTVTGMVPFYQKVHLR